MDVYVLFCWPKWSHKFYKTTSVFWKFHLDVHKYLEVHGPPRRRTVPWSYHRLSYRTCRYDINTSVSYRLRLSDTFHYKVGSIFWGPVIIHWCGILFIQSNLVYVLGGFKTLSLNCYPNQIVGGNHPQCDFFSQEILATKRKPSGKFHSLHPEKFLPLTPSRPARGSRGSKTRLKKIWKGGETHAEFYTLED